MNGGLLKTWKDQGLTQQQIIEKIYMRCISRAPTEAESSTLLKMISEAPNEEQGLQDVFWAVLNSREFIFNH